MAFNSCDSRFLDLTQEAHPHGDKDFFPLLITYKECFLIFIGSNLLHSPEVPGNLVYGMDHADCLGTTTPKTQPRRTATFLQTIAFRFMDGVVKKGIARVDPKPSSQASAPGYRVAPAINEPQEQGRKNGSWPKRDPQIPIHCHCCPPHSLIRTTELNDIIKTSDVGELPDIYHASVNSRNIFKTMEATTRA